MSWAVSVRAEAEDDLVEARDWYEEKVAGLEVEFLAEFAFAMRQLEADPLREHLYYRQFRRVILRRFPYKVFYQVLTGHQVVVFRVLHGKRAHQREYPR